VQDRTRSTDPDPSMLQFAVTLLQWLPRIYIWMIIPVTCLSILLVPARKLRPHAALGFIAALAISGVLLALEMVAFGYICCDQARMLFSILLDFRPGVTVGFALALFGSMAKPLAGMLPMVVGAAATGIGTFVLRRRNRTGSMNDVATPKQNESVS